MIWVYHPPSSRIPGQGWRLARRFPNNWGSWYRSNRNFELRSPKLNETWNEIYHVSINFFKGTIQNCLCKYIYICMFTYTYIYIYINCIFEIYLYNSIYIYTQHKDERPSTFRFRSRIIEASLWSCSFAAIRHLVVSVHVCAMSASASRWTRPSELWRSCANKIGQMLIL